MTTPAIDPGAGGDRARHADSRGFTLIEVLIAMMILTIALVAIAGMFPTGYKQVVDAGRMTLAVTVGRQILEDMRLVPFADLLTLDNFDSQNPGTVPGADPAMSIATRWQNDFPAAEGQATIQVLDCGDVTNPCALPGGADADLRQATVTVSVSALQQTVSLTTLFVRMF